MKVSIIIPAFNAASFISRGIESVINQTYKDLELIVIDDGSSDETAEVVTRFANTDSRVKLYRKENGGVSSARNAGLKHVTGDYLLFLDSDDWLDRNAVRFLLEKQNENRDSFICCSCCIIDQESGKKKEGIIPNSTISVLTRDEAIITDSKTSEFRLSSSCYKLFDAKCIVDNDIFFSEDIYFAEDGLFTFSYLLTQRKVAFYPDPLWFILDRNDSASNSSYNQKMSTMTIAYDRMIRMANYSNSIEKEIINSQIRKTLYLLSICLGASSFYKSDIVFFRKTLRKYKNRWKNGNGYSLKKLIVLCYLPICILRLRYKLSNH